MAPILFGVRAYSVLVVLAIAASVIAGAVSARRAGMSIRTCLGVQLVLLAAALAGAKVFWLCQIGVLQPPSSLVRLDGFRYPGALLGLLVGLALAARLFRISIAEFGDIVAASIAVGAAVIRVGCFLEGCCFGAISDLPWAVRFPQHSMVWNHHEAAELIADDAAHSLPVHPLQIYFGLWSFAVAMIIFGTQGRQRYPGQLLLLFLVLHEGGKAALESLRVPSSTALQLASLCVALLAAIVLIVNGWRRAALPQESPLTRPQGEPAG